MISISLFYCCKKMFIHLNTWMIDKNSIRHHCLMHGKRVCKNFEIQSLGEYHDVYVQSDALLLANVFEKNEP